MIANEMRFQFKSMYNSQVQGGMSFDDNEISKYLTHSYRLYVSQKLFGNTSLPSYGFEIAKNDTDLSELQYFLIIEEGYDSSTLKSLFKDSEGNIKKDESSNTIFVNAWSRGNYPNSKTITLFNDYFYNIQERVDIEDSKGILYKDVSVLPINQDQYNYKVADPHNKPDYELIWRITNYREVQGYDESVTDNTYSDRTNRRVTLILPDGFTLKRYKHAYIKVPDDIVCDRLNTSNQKHCILNSSAHDDIVAIAVRLARASTESNYSIADKEFKENL